MTDDTVNIGQAPDQTQTVNITPTTPQVDVQTANLRADKARFGLSKYLPDYTKDAWYTSIISGQEGTARKAASASINYADTQRRLQELHDTGELSPPNLSNPDSVIETGFADQFMHPMTDMSNDFYKNSLYGDANRTNPGAVGNAAAITASVVTAQEQTKNAYQTMASEIGAAGSDIYKQFTNPGILPNFLPRLVLDALKVINAPVAGTGAEIENTFPSLKKAQQQGQIIPLESVSDALDVVILGMFGEARGPGAGTALEAGESASDRVLSKLDKIRAVAEDPRTDPGTRAVAQSILDRMRGTVPTADAEKVAKAATDSVKASASVNGERPIETVQAATHGDLPTAAQHQITEDVNAGNSLKVERDRDIRSLTSNFRLDQTAIEENPGNYGQDLVNRVRDANDGAVTNLSKKIQTVMKVNRTPMVMAQDAVVRDEQERIRGTYRGIDNAILDIGSPEYDELGNVWNSTVKIGTFDGELFTTAKQAKLFAELHGIHVKTETVPDKPIGNMIFAPSKYETFTKFRAGARRAGISNAELKSKGFGSSTEFQTYKDNLGKPEDIGATVENQGSGFYIKVKKPFKEDSESLVGDPKTGLASTPDTRTPRSWLSSFAKGFLRLPEGFLTSPPIDMSNFEMSNRRVTAHTPSEIKALAQNDWDIVDSIHKDNWDKFNQLLDFGRDLYDKDGEKGYFFESPGEIEDWYYLFFPNAGRPPGDLIEGYFAFKRLNNMDLALRNISMYRYQSRVGAEQHQWTVKDKDGNRVKSGFISGIKVDKLPAGDDSVMILGPSNQKGAEQFVSAKKLGTTALGKKITEDVQQGKAHVVRLWDPDQKQLGSISKRANGTRVRYVISYSPPETKPLDIGQMVSRRGGGHFDYKFEGHVVQPIVEHDPVTNTHNYVGDRIMTMHDNPGEGKHFAREANIVREYRKAGMYDEARAVARDRLAMGDEEFSKWFAPREMPNGGKMAPYLSDEHPLKYIRRGESYIDHADDEFTNKYRKVSFRDATTSGSDAAQFKVQYTQKRDAENMFGARNKGTVQDPLWSYEPVKMVNPIAVTARAINRVANSLAGDDMKIAAMTHWLKEAEPYLDYGKNTHSIIWASPWRTFNSEHLPWKNNSETLAKRMQLKGNRLKIKSFSGAFNPQERYMHAQAVKLAESLYGKGYIKASIAPTWALPGLSDPWRVARSVAVHPILGMFKPSAFGMQLTTWSNVVGIAGPTHAGPGFIGALLHEATRVNDHPNTIALYDKFASEFGFNPGEFKEAYEHFIDSGFFNVGSEHAYENNSERYWPLKNFGNELLHAGMTPFREGAQFVRAASWFTAYHEYRNGGGGRQFDITSSFGSNWKGNRRPIDREGWERILNRAGTLDHNMSRASTAPYQQGPGSLPTMFWAYKLRLTELMLSKQLTKAEKIRLFGTSTLMFGLAYGGAGLFGVPVGDYVRSSLLSGNWNVPLSEALTGSPVNMFHTTPYVTGQHFWLSAAIEGLPAAFIAWLTGALDNKQKSIGQTILDINKQSFKEARQSGLWLNFGEYFGNQSLAEDIVRDKTIMQMVFGAPGAFIGNAYKTSTKVAADIYHLVTTGDKGTTLNDILEAARSINAVNVAWNVVTAIGTHNWMTRNNTVMQGDVSVGQALFQAAFGLHDQQSLDAYERRRILNHAVEVRNHAEHEAVAELHFRKDSLENNDPDSAEAHRIKAMSYLAVAEHPALKDPKKMEAFINKALDSYQKNIPEDINKKFFNPKRYPKGVSDEQLESARKGYYEMKGQPDPYQPNAPGQVDTATTVPKTKAPKPERSHHKKAP